MFWWSSIFATISWTVIFNSSFSFWRVVILSDIHFARSVWTSSGLTSSMAGAPSCSGPGWSSLPSWSWGGWGSSTNQNPGFPFPGRFSTWTSFRCPSFSRKTCTSLLMSSQMRPAFPAECLESGLQLVFVSRDDGGPRSSLLLVGISLVLARRGLVLQPWIIG